MFWLNRSKNGSREIKLYQNHAKTIREDLAWGYVIEASDAHIVRQPSDREYFLSLQLVVNPNKLGKWVGTEWCSRVP